ncbi:MAG: alkaline phosphatase family protein [Chitinophagaceae bacterium]
MKQFILGFCFLFSNTILVAQVNAKKAIFIIVDGIPADVIEKLNLPNLRAITKTGGYSKAIAGGEYGGYSQTPTISAVGYNSIITGTWANKHNVWGNDIKTPNYNYQNIFRLLKEQFPKKKIGIYSSWQDNRTKLVGEAMLKAGNIRFDYKVDGLELDTINYPHDENSNYMHLIDEKVAVEAAQSVLTFAPDLSWVYLEYTDDIGHKYGDGPEYYKAISYADEQVGKIWKAIQLRERNYNEDWLIIITTDHGRDAKTGKDHGGQSNRERAGWIITNSKTLNSYFKENKCSIVDIMPTIARFMNIRLAAAAAREIDGVPFVGDLSVTDPRVEYTNGKATVKWKSKDPTGMVKIWMAASNDYKKGSSDTYILLKQVPAKLEKAVINLQKFRSSFYKIAIEGKWNTVNRWVLAGIKK